MSTNRSMDTSSVPLFGDRGKGRNCESKGNNGDKISTGKMASRGNPQQTEVSSSGGSHEFPVDSQGSDDILDDCTDMDLYFRPRSESPDMFRSTGRPSTFTSSYDGAENVQQHHDTAPTSPSNRFELSYEIEDSHDEVRSESGGVRSRGRSTIRGRGNRGGARPCSGSTTPLASSPLVSAEKKRSGRGRGTKRSRTSALSRVGEAVDSETGGVASTSAADDVYEFKSSPEGEFTLIQPEFGNRDEKEQSAPSNTKRQRLGEPRPDSHGGSAHSGDIEMDDIEDDECSTKPTNSDRKVPPLRISLPITQSEEDMHGEASGQQLVPGNLSSANRKGPRSRHGKRQNDADDAQRMTRSKVRQTGRVLDDTDAWAKKKRGRVNTTTGDEADESAADDTSPAGEGSDDTSPTGQASNSASIPESLSSEQRIIYENPRSGMYHLKKLLAERWLTDLRKQNQNHIGEDEKYKNMLLLTGDYFSRRVPDDSVMEGTEIKKEQPTPTEVECCSIVVKEEAASEDESNAINLEMKEMWKDQNEERINMMNKMHKERIRLRLFWEQEFLRMEQREKSTAPLMSAARFLRENEMCNAQILEESIEPLKPMSRDDFGERMNKSINQLYNMHKMEASSLFGLQRDMWRYEARRRGLDVNHQSIKQCVPLVKVERVDFPY
ncbi:hypothetical protein KIN20_033882 [Parelaphostrongylus tenuis]|uniref:Uncharacterized protein n=1 Tax=Parelaphostrongylus tenuis TaxID=148309 RepID=A0AAD5R989_PARTN|nr:hypothetical protein KIN20_033882 [Parelaphostrongylus tenuis]